MGKGSIPGIMQVPVVVRKTSFVPLGERFEMNVGAEIIQISLKGRLPVVVVDLAVAELDMFDC